MDAIELLRKQQAENRMRSVKPAQSASELYRYIGFDAESGMAIVSNGSDTIQGSRITNGAIKLNQPVKVLQANNRVAIDSMPHPNPAPPPVPVEPPGKVKVLYVANGAVWVGGWKRQPQRVTALNEQNPFPFWKVKLNNLGGDRWIASWYDRKEDIVTYQSSGGSYRFSDTPEGKAWLEREKQIINSPDSETLIDNLGFGFWRYNFQELRYGENNAQTGRGRIGYWIKDEIDSRPYQVSASEGQFEEPVLPGRFDGAFWSARGNFIQQQPRTVLINSRLSMSYAIRSITNTPAFSNFLGLSPENGYWTLSEEDRQIVQVTGDRLKIFPAESGGFERIPYLRQWNWIDERLFFTNLKLINEGDQNGVNTDYDEAPLRKDAQIEIEEHRFADSLQTQASLDLAVEQEGVRLKGLERVRTFKTPIYRIPAQDFYVLDISYHP